MLEWIEPGARNKKFWREFGEALARQHKVKWNHFGWKEDNYMGALPQSNQPNADWISFYISERLEPQIKLSIDNGLLDQSHYEQFEKLFHSLKNIFSDEKPCLVHGDLWSGNFICDKNSQPVLIDPAVYFGHRMVDIGMTKLFGGFDEEFYEAYHHQYPIVGEEEEQISVCQLYPLLVHLNLFGRSYLPDILNILDHLT
ncbi:MAG TPA: fructosamine kinase family protein, partial [Puia sp.]|nr:fructosamine kinase family protein [Puia sp.]